jgi:transmembrane sensor
MTYATTHNDQVHVSIFRSTLVTASSPQGKEHDDIADAAADWFARLRSDQVTVEDQQRFRTWVSQSTAHAQAFARIQSLWSTLDGPSQDVWTEIKQATPTPVPAGPRRSLSFPPRWQTVGLLGIALAVTLQLPGVLRYWHCDYRTDYGERRVLQLDDGSRITMNTRTAISVRFSAARREVHLAQGQIFVEVRHDPSRPFTVISDNGKVEDIGTRFDVYDMGSALEVGVTEGTVAVTGTNAGSTILKAGWQTVITDAGTAIPQHFDTTSGSAWRNGKLIFKLRPLGEVVAELNRYRYGRIFITDRDLRERLVSGVINLHTADDPIQTLKNTLHVQSIGLGSTLTWLYTP